MYKKFLIFLYCILTNLYSKGIFARLIKKGIMMVKLISVLADKIILAVKAAEETDIGFREKDLTVVIDNPAKAIEMDILETVGHDKRFEMLWIGNKVWHDYLRKHQWSKKIDADFPLGEKIATSIIDRMKMIYFLESIDYDEEVCKLLLEPNKERAEAQREVLGMNIAELAYRAKGKKC